MPKHSPQVRQRKAKEKYEENVRKKAKKAAARDHAEEILGTSLVTSTNELDIQLRARATSKASRVSFLKDQFHARISGESPRSYPGIGPEYRSKHGKLKMTTNDTSQGDEQYLRALVEAMITEDGGQIGDHMPNFTEHFIRTLPTLSLEFTNPKSCELKAEFSELIASLAAPTDDPVYIALHGKYIGKILYDFETRARGKLFRVASIQFIRSYTSTRFSCWEATCEPVFRDASTGHFRVPQEMKVPDSNVTITNALQGYCVAEYVDGLDAEPTFLPWVDQYITHFRDVIMPKYTSPFEHIDASSSSMQDLPSGQRTSHPQKDKQSNKRTCHPQPSETNASSRRTKRPATSATRSKD